MIVYTSICMNYLPKALVLGESLKKHNKDVKFYILLLEREIPKEVTEEMLVNVDKIILAKDLGYDDFDKFIFKHSIVEASTSVKGQALWHFLNNEEDEKIIYLDPDIKVYNKLSKLDKLLNDNEIVLTPHATIPEQKEADIQNNELCALKHGVYNLGFLAIRRGEESKRFVKWWMDRLNLYCYNDIPNGIFTDQKWVDLAPAMFKVHILKDLGHNMAPWNLSTRIAKKHGDKVVINSLDELVFFHFSGFDSGDNLQMFEFYRKNLDAYEFVLRDEYIKDLERNAQLELGNYVWSYANYFNGEKISNVVRKYYRDTRLFNFIEENPFSFSEEYFHNRCNITENINYEEIVNKITKSRTWRYTEWIRRLRSKWSKK